MSDRALSLLEEAYGADSTNLTYARALSAGYIEAGRMQDALHINERLSAADPKMTTCAIASSSSMPVRES